MHIFMLCIGLLDWIQLSIPHLVSERRPCISHFYLEESRNVQEYSDNRLDRTRKNISYESTTIEYIIYIYIDSHTKDNV